MCAQGTSVQGLTSITPANSSPRGPHDFSRSAPPGPLHDQAHARADGIKAQWDVAGARCGSPPTPQTPLVAPPPRSQPACGPPPPQSRMGEPHRAVQGELPPGHGTAVCQLVPRWEACHSGKAQSCSSVMGARPPAHAGDPGVREVPQHSMCTHRGWRPQHGARRRWPRNPQSMHLR